MAKRKKKAKATDLVGQLKTEISNSGLTSYMIGKRSNTAPIVIDRFMSGERSLRLDTAARLCEVLGLELRPKK